MSIRKIQKLDQRHSGIILFKYYVEPNSVPGVFSGKSSTLQQWREWAWSQFGPGAERDIALILRDEREWRWAWDTDHGNMRLYLKGDEELSWFTLKWQ